MSSEIGSEIKRSKVKDWSIRSVASIAVAGSSLLGSQERAEEPLPPIIPNHVLFIEGFPNLSPEIYLNVSSEIGPELPHNDIATLYKVQADFEMAVTEALRIQVEEEKRQLEEQNKKVLAPSRPEAQAAVVVKIQTDGTDVWTVLADCESGDGQVGAPYYVNWAYNGPSDFDGAFQFLPSTWKSLEAAVGYEFAWQAPPDVQIAAARELVERGGWDSQFPGCAAEMRAAGYID